MSAVRRCVLVAWLMAPLFFVGQSSAQSGKDYLDTLKDEAEGLKLDSKAVPVPDSGGQLTTTGTEGNVRSGAIKKIESGLTVEQFETLLKHNYIGTFLFYERLSADKQRELFEFYQRNPDPQLLRDKILQMNKN